MRHVLIATLVIALAGAVLARDGGAQAAGGATHNIFGSLVEVKGGTTADRLAPPPVNPKDLSKGYEFKGPGVADRNNPQRWEVSSYMFNPAWVTVRQGDQVVLTAFVVNGDEHEVWVNGPDGSPVVPKTVWQRGREYRVSFTADRPGAYQLVCSNHAPSMTATFFALPR